MLLLWIASTAVFWGLLTAWDHYFETNETEDDTHPEEPLTLGSWNVVAPDVLAETTKDVVHADVAPVGLDVADAAVADEGVTPPLVSET